MEYQVSCLSIPLGGGRDILLQFPTELVAEDLPYIGLMQDYVKVLAEEAATTERKRTVSVAEAGRYLEGCDG